MPTRSVLEVLTSLIEVPSSINLDNYDPWLKTLDDHDLSLYRSRDLLRQPAGNFDLLAHYVPFHELTVEDHLQRYHLREPTWGIYVTTGGIETLAREAFLPAGYGTEEALKAAAIALSLHELFHFLTEVAITGVELVAVGNGAVAGHYLTHRRMHTSHCEIEEGLANQHVLRLSDSAEATALRQWMAAGPPGYRDFARYDDPLVERAGLREVLAHACGVPTKDQPALAEFGFDLGTVHIDISAVPLHLEVSQGSAYEAGEWKWPIAVMPSGPWP